MYKYVAIYVVSSVNYTLMSLVCLAVAKIEAVI